MSATPDTVKRMRTDRQLRAAAPPNPPNDVASHAAKWSVVPLGEIAEIKLGKMLDKAKHQTGRRLPYLRNINVRWGTVDTDDLLEMNFEEDQLDRFGLKANDVLVCEGGEPGRASVWNGSLPDLKFQKALHRVRFKVPFEPRLLVYFLELLARTGGLERRFTGSTIKHFTREAFVRLPIPFPPEDEQKRIVAEIEKQFTRLDAGVAALRRVQANVKRYRAAVLKAACEGRLVPTEAELAKAENRKFETGEQMLTRVLAERRLDRRGRSQHKEPVAIATAHLSQLPDGWASATVGQLSTLVQYGSSAKTNEDATGIPVLRMGNIREGKFDLGKLKYLPKAHDEFPELLLARGDLLFNRTNSAELVGKTAVFKDSPEPCSFASYLIRVRFGDGCVPEYVSYFINSVFGRAWIASVVTQQVGQANVNGAKLQSLVVPLPPLGEQKRIVAEVERRFSVAEELEAVVSVDLRRAGRLRQSILQRAFAPIGIASATKVARGR